MRRIFALFFVVVFVFGMFFTLPLRSDALVFCGNMRFGVDHFFTSEVKNVYWSLSTRKISDGSFSPMVPAYQNIVRCSTYQSELSDASDVRVNRTATEIQVHLGQKYDVCFTYQCPTTGMIECRYSARLRSSVVTKDGFRGTVYHNDQEVWPKEDGVWTSGGFNLDVQKGDRITLVLSNNGDASDDDLIVDYMDIRYRLGESCVRVRDPYRIVCMGDVFTRYGYPEFLEEDLNDSKTRLFEVSDVAASWATAVNSTQRTSYRLYGTGYRTVTVTEKKDPPDCILLCFGVNDSVLTDFTADGYRDEYLKMYQQLKKLDENIEIYLLTSPYVAQSGGVGVEYSVDANVLREQIVPLQREIAEACATKLIDVYSYTEQLYKATGKAYPSHDIRRDVAEYIFNALCGDGIPGLNSQMATYAAEVVSYVPEPPSGVTVNTDLPSSGSADLPSTDSVTDTALESDSGTSTFNAAPSDSAVSSDSAGIQSSDLSLPEKNNGWILWTCLGVLVVSGACVGILLMIRKKK